MSNDLKEAFKRVEWQDRVNIASNPLPYSPVCTPPRSYLQPHSCPPYCGAPANCCPNEFTTDMYPMQQDYYNPQPAQCVPDPNTKPACADRAEAVVHRQASTEERDEDATESGGDDNDDDDERPLRVGRWRRRRRRRHPVCACAARAQGSSMYYDCMDEAAMCNDGFYQQRWMGGGAAMRGYNPMEWSAPQQVMLVMLVVLIFMVGVLIFRSSS